MLLTLRNHVVGPELFDFAFREYIRNWAFKHPTPGDFFRTIENAAGRDLSWYWREYWYTTGLLDIAIDSVSQGQQGTQSLATVSLHRRTAVLLPVRLRFKYANGATGDFSLPANIWANGDRFDATIAVPAKVVGARLWPDQSVPDWNHDNDTWGDAPPSDAIRSRHATLSRLNRRSWYTSIGSARSDRVDCDSKKQLNTNRSTDRMPDFGSWAADWWKPVLFIVIAGHITNVCVTLFLHRSQTHRSVKLHYLAALPMRLWLWLSTAIVTKEWVACHRKHHAFADREGDPHSPLIEGLRNIVLKGALLL